MLNSEVLLVVTSVAISTVSLLAAFAIAIYYATRTHYSALLFHEALKEIRYEIAILEQERSPQTLTSPNLQNLCDNDWLNDVDQHKIPSDELFGKDEVLNPQNKEFEINENNNSVTINNNSNNNQLVQQRLKEQINKQKSTELFDQDMKINKTNQEDDQIMEKYEKIRKLKINQLKNK